MHTCRRAVRGRFAVVCAEESCFTATPGGESGRSGAARWVGWHAAREVGPGGPNRAGRPGPGEILAKSGGGLGFRRITHREREFFDRSSPDGEIWRLMHVSQAREGARLTKTARFSAGGFRSRFGPIGTGRGTCQKGPVRVVRAAGGADVCGFARTYEGIEIACAFPHPAAMMRSPRSDRNRTFVQIGVQLLWTQTMLETNRRSELFSW